MELNKNCKVFARTIEESAISQIYEISNHQLFKDTTIRIMPDAHSGKNCVIGTTYNLTDFVCPSHVGVDIGCGIETFITNKKVDPSEYTLIEHRVRKEIPFGMNINNQRVFDMKEFLKFMKNGFNRIRSQWSEMIDDLVDISEDGFTDMCRRIGMDEKTFYKSLSTLGSGNHFVEFGITPEGNYAFTIHTGSRNFGLKVCKYWEKIASNMQYDRAEYREAIKRIKKTAKNRNDIPRLIAEYQKELESKQAPNGYLSGDNMVGYITDMAIAQLYAQFNRNLIARKIEEILYKINQAKVVEVISSIHNYIDYQDHIIRKGAIRAYEGEKMVVPFNMRDGLAICVGKSNADWNNSCSHGAGRVMSRSAAKKNLSIDRFKEQMKGIYSTSVCKSTIDEAPDAYKPMDEIVDAISETCDILYMIKPIINLKSTDEVREE